MDERIMLDGKKVDILDGLVSGYNCERCGFTFVDITPQDVIEAHIMRHIDEKVEEHKWRTSRGQHETADGWFYANGTRAL